MKKIFTLCTVTILSLLSKNVFAQINENFENGLAPLQADCWEFNSMMYASAPSAYLINGNGSLYSEPPTNSDSIRAMKTPFLAVSSSIDVSFVYKLSSNLNGMSSRYIKVDLVNSSNVVVQNLYYLNVTNSATTSTLFNQTFAVAVPGFYKLMITMGGSHGGGNVRVSMDNLNVNAPVIGCVAGAALPVHLVSFQGNLDKNNKVNLNWVVADNETASSFEIEKSVNGKDFSSAAIILASEKRGTENYTYTEPMNSSEKIMFRLKMTDKGHYVDYSKILVFQTRSSADTKIKIIGNPVKDRLTFSYNTTSPQQVTVKVYEMSGRMMMNKNINCYEGSNMISLTLNNTFTPGMYVVEVNNGNQTETTKFIKQ